MEEAAGGAGNVDAEVLQLHQQVGREKAGGRRA